MAELAPPLWQTGTAYAPVETMAEWLVNARPRDRMIYARGPALDPREGAAQLVARWVRQGEATTVQRRRDGVLEYLAERLAPGREPAAAPARPATLDPQSAAGRVYDTLRRCANLDQECPTNEALAQRLGLADRHAAGYLVRKLADHGHIRITEPARFGPRIIYIVATGKSTATPARAEHGR